MNDKIIYLSPKFEFFFTFPFNLGFSIERSPMPEYQYSLMKVANLLNENFQNYIWSMELFEDSLPLSLKNKGGIILGKSKKSTNISGIIKTAFERERIGATFDERVDETLVYFDHGVGSINLSIHATLESTDAIKNLQQLAMAIIGNIRKREDSLYIFEKWVSFREAMLKSYEDANVLYDMWGILMTGGEGRELTRYIGENAILQSIDTSPLKISIDDIPVLFAPFTGLKPEENINLLPFTSGIIYLAEGWDGQIAIVCDNNRKIWLKNLWQFATDYATILHDFDRYLYLRTANLRKESVSLSLRQAKREMEAINRIELSIDVLSHEILPHNFGGILEEIQVYKGIYTSWEIKKITESLKQKFNSLNTMFTNLNSRVSTLMQVRMNIIMLIFTVLTLSGVLADVISTTDFNGEFLNPRFRLFIILFGTISIALLLIITLSVIRIFNRKLRYFKK
jgi:hypothetical protein